MINILGYSFEGPYYEMTTNFNEAGAVYVILDRSNNKIDVGETDRLKTRLVTHERRNCWERYCGKDIYVATLGEENKEKRLIIEKRIRNSYRFPCGEE